MKFIALDLSTKSSGWAIFEDKELLEYGCVTASSNNLLARIDKITKEIEELLKTKGIQKVVLEEVRPEGSSGNIATHRALMWLQGSIAMACHRSKLKKDDMILYYPSTWRKECGIVNGRGVKRQTAKKADIEFANKQFGLELTNDDIADAICIGHAYFKKELNVLNWG